MPFRPFASGLFLLLMAAQPGSAAEGTAAPQSLLPQASVDESVALSARWDLGYYLFQLQDYPGAVAEFEKLRVVMPKDATLLALIGSCYSMSGRWTEGEKALLQAWAQNRDDADLNGLIGQFYQSAKQYMKGAFYLERALRIAPELEDLRARLIDIYLDAGQFEKGFSHLEALLKERGNQFGDPELDNAYARCLVHFGKYKEALRYALSAHESDPANPRYSRILGMTMMGLNRFSEASRFLSASRPWIDGTGEVYLQLGESLFQDRRWDEAEGAWMEGTRKFPESYALLSRLMEYQLSTAHREKAERVLAFARMQNPGHPGNLLLEARLGRKLGSYSSSRMALDRLKRRACGALAMEALWEEAQLEYELGRFAACGKLLDRLLMEGSRRADAHLLKAKLALMTGDLASAQSQVLAAKAANPYDIKVYAMARVAFGASQDRDKLNGLLRDAESLLAGSDAYAYATLRTAP